jgi:ubiquinone/menaquinone biosynthesis C-methylase UbiE
MLQQADVDAPGYGEKFSQDLHFGFWRDAESAAPATTVAGYKLAMEALTDAVLDLAQARSPCRIIDVGCGFGGGVTRIDRTVSNSAIVGLNIDERQIDVARHLCGPGTNGNEVSFVVADAQDTRLPANSFDVAIAIESILHMPRRDRFLREMFRILKPGGRLVTTEIAMAPLETALNLVHVLSHAPLLKRYKAKVGPLGPPGTVGSYRRLARRTGFELTAMEDWARNVLPTYPSLKVVKQDEAHLPDSVFAPRLLDFGAMMMRKGAQKYLAVRFRKPE